MSPGLNNLNIFGCRAYTYQNQGKLEPRSQISIFVGYHSSTKGYILAHKIGNTYKFTINRNIIFKEDRLLGFLVTKQPEIQLVIIPISMFDFEIGSSSTIEMLPPDNRSSDIEPGVSIKKT